MRMRCLLLLVTVLAHPAGVYAADTDETKKSSSFTQTPYAALSTGYDSNPDQEVNGEGSGFNQGNLGLRLGYEQGSTEVDFRLEGIYRELWDNEDPDRWRYRASIDVETGLTEDGKLELGLKRTGDAILLPPTTTDNAYAAVRHETKALELRLESFAERERNGSGDDEDDYHKFGVRNRSKALPKEKLSPFLKVEYAYVEFPNQDTSFADKNGHDIAAIAGLSWQPSSKLRIDLGGRFNIRLLEDDDTSHYENGFIEFDLEWQPTDDITLTAAIERRLDEPSTDEGVVEDETNYRAGLSWQVAERILFETKASYKREKEIGAGEIKNEWEAEAKISYDLTDDFRLFTEAGFLWNREKTSGEPAETFDQLVIAGGVETTF